MNVASLGTISSADSHQAPSKAEAAKNFESMVIGAMLTPMFKTMGDAPAPFGGGQEAKEFQPFFISAIAKSMEARGGLGLSGVIEAALAPKAEPQKDPEQKAQ